MTVKNPYADSLARQYVDERYHVLRDALAVVRRRPDWGLRLDQATEIRQEIRAMVRVRWYIRRQTRQRTARREAVLRLGYHQWQSLPEAIYDLSPGPLSEDELLAGIRP